MKTNVDLLIEKYRIKIEKVKELIANCYDEGYGSLLSTQLNCYVNFMVDLKELKGVN